MTSFIMMEVLHGNDSILNQLTCTVSVKTFKKTFGRIIIVPKHGYQVYMFGAKHGFAQSMDRTAQSADTHFAQTIHGLFHLT